MYHKKNLYKVFVSYGYVYNKKSIIKLMHLNSLIQIIYTGYNLLYCTIEASYAINFFLNLTGILYWRLVSVKYYA